MEEKFRIIRQIFNTFFFRIVIAGIAFSRIFIVGRSFLKGEDGVYSLIIDIIGIGLYFFGLNIYAYMMRSIPGKSREQGISIFKTVLFLEVFTALVFIGLIILFQIDKLFCEFSNIEESQNLVRLGFLVVIMQILAMDFARYNSAIKEIEYGNFISFFNSSFWLIILLVFMAFGIRISIPMFFLTWMLGSSITIFLGLKRIGFFTFIRSKIDYSIIKAIILFVLPLVLSTVGHYLVTISSKTILSHYYQKEAAAVYFYAYTPFARMYEFVTAVVVSVFVPYVVEAHNRNNLERKFYFLSIMLKYTLIGAIPIIIGIVIGRYELINFLTKQAQNLEAAKIIPYIAFMPIITILIYPAYYTLYLENKTLKLGLVYFICGIINVGLNLLTIPKYSYYGAAVSTVLSLFLVLIIFYFMTSNILKLRWKFINFSRIFIVTCVAGIISWFVYTMFISENLPGYVRLMLLGAFILIVFSLGLYKLRVFEQKELRILKDFKDRIFNRS